jgi:hypothetical protein
VVVAVAGSWWPATPLVEENTDRRRGRGARERPWVASSGSPRRLDGALHNGKQRRGVRRGAKQCWLHEQGMSFAYSLGRGSEGIRRAWGSGQNQGRRRRFGVLQRQSGERRSQFQPGVVQARV